MRNDFVKQTLLEMERDKNIFFLTGDLGFNALELIQKRFPSRFINAGIAEGNMIGLAAGLALTGKKVICYSIASFLTMRPYEQIRTDICYDNLDVKLFGPGGGYNYPTHGVTHHTIEDVAIMNVLPNMTVVCPAYSWEAREATSALIRRNGPTYMRLSKSPGEHYQHKKWRFGLGKGYEIRKGKDVALISTGNILDAVIETARLIEKKSGKKVGVVSMPCLKPIDEKLILGLAKSSKLICTIEEHSIIGGLGSIVASILVQSPVSNRSRFRMFGIPDRFVKDVGSRNYLLDKAGLSPKILSTRILKLLK